MSQAQYEGEQEAAGAEVVANALPMNMGSQIEYVGMEGEAGDLEFVHEDENGPSSAESAK